MNVGNNQQIGRHQKVMVICSLITIPLMVGGCAEPHVKENQSRNDDDDSVMVHKKALS